MGLIPQGEPTTNNENEIQIKREENSTEETPEQQLQPGNSSSDNEEEESIQPNNSEGATQMPIKGSIKWEKPRTSARVTKKPDRCGNIIMISKVEQESTAEEESLPSVIEIPNPKLL